VKAGKRTVITVASARRSFRVTDDRNAVVINDMFFRDKVLMMRFQRFATDILKDGAYLAL
ncbi:12861_t:CDS:1, partial [Acaulospora morrowiae]